MNKDGGFMRKNYFKWQHYLALISIVSLALFASEIVIFLENMLVGNFILSRAIPTAFGFGMLYLFIRTEPNKKK